MRVLDIDLDFFLADCCPLAEPGERPVLSGHEPWAPERVRAFLEEQCGLSKARPLPGRIFDTHDKALVFWQERIREGRLTLPFSVTHVDAHSDLGIGFPGPGAVLNGVLPVQLSCRDDLAPYYARKQLDEANYLLFALAFRYIDRLENVRNPKSRRDFPREILHENGSIHLTSFAARLLEGINGPEPEILYEEFSDYTAFFTKGPYDYMTVAISPRYAPKEAEALLPIFREYLEEI